MTSKYNLKEKAVALRKEGYSYSEILKEVPVAKSTLSIWLHSVGLAKYQKQRLTEKKIAGMRRGAEAQHQKRIDITQLIIEKAKSEVGYSSAPSTSSTMDMVYRVQIAGTQGTGAYQNNIVYVVAPSF
jgi:hypothetical protein